MGVTLESSNRIEVLTEPLAGLLFPTSCHPTRYAKKLVFTPLKAIFSHLLIGQKSFFMSLSHVNHKTKGQYLSFLRNFRIFATV